MSYYVGIKKVDIPAAKELYAAANYEVEVFPYTKKGCTQTHWRKLRITPSGYSSYERMLNSRKLRNSNIKQYIEDW